MSVNTLARMLNYDDLKVFGEQIINTPQVADKHNVASFVYQPNCKNFVFLCDQNTERHSLERIPRICFSS